MKSSVIGEFSDTPTHGLSMRGHNELSYQKGLKLLLQKRPFIYIHNPTQINYTKALLGVVASVF